MSLSSFYPIGPRTRLYTPSAPTPGELIIICTWLGAASKHIAKYTALYHRVAPGARILLIESNVPILISSYKRQRRELGPAVSAVRASIDECSANTKPKILLHTFSNGGTNTASNLIIRLHERRKEPLPIACLVFDSSPAKGTYWKSYTAMVLSLPRDVVTRLLGPLAVHCILIALYTWIGCGNENPASLQRRTLLNEGVTVEKAWKGTGVVNATGADQEVRGTEDSVSKDKGEGRAVYLYSKEDLQCDWRDITEHAQDARDGGWEVEEMCFDGSPHCAHYTKFEKDYGEAVEDVWRSEAKNGVWLRSKL